MATCAILAVSVWLLCDVVAAQDEPPPAAAQQASIPPNSTPPVSNTGPAADHPAQAIAPPKMSPAGSVAPEAARTLPQLDTPQHALGSSQDKHSAPPPVVATAMPDSSTRSPSSSTLPWLAWSGWLISLLLGVYLIRAQSQWRTTFANKEWLLLPSDYSAHITNSLQGLINKTSTLATDITGSAQSHSRSVEAISHAIRETRAEFAILREDLDRKTKEIADLRLGHEFNNRRSTLRTIAHALQIIEEDQHSGASPDSTLAGVATELRECLQDNAVIARIFEPGTRLADTKGVSSQESLKEPAAEDSLKGTIGETIRSAYVVVGPSGAEEILRHARVKIYT